MKRDKGKHFANFYDREFIFGKPQGLQKSFPVGKDDYLFCGLIAGLAPKDWVCGTEWLTE